jgi:hypothetical protein
MTRRIIRQGWDPQHDERVDPHHNLEPHMPDPDWGNVLIHPDQKKMPVGDPTLWANTVTTLVDQDPILGNTPRTIQGDQIVLVQAADRYSRSWSLNGLVFTSTDAWNSFASSANPPTSPYDAGARDLNNLAIWLSITQGIEKITFEQQILLMAGNTSANYGLCNNQFTLNNGPYGELYNSLPPSESDQQGRAFAAIGALIGNTISIRPIITRGGVPGSQGIVGSVTISLILTPYAPGAGI